MRWLGLKDMEAFHTYWMNVAKQQRDEQRTKQQRDARATIEAKVLPVINAAMLVGASARLLAGGLRAPGAAPRTGAPAAEPQAGAGGATLPKAAPLEKPPLVAIPEELKGASGAEAAAKLGLPKPPPGYRWMKTGDGKLTVARKPGAPPDATELNYNPAKGEFEPEPAARAKPAVVPAANEVAGEFEAQAQQALEARDGISGVPAPKTGASVPDGTTKVSGWGKDVHSLDPVKSLSKKIGQPLSPDPTRDAPDYPGSYNLSHAEKQIAVVRPNQPVGVSKEMCLDCQQFYQRLANATGRPQIVADPTGIRVFLPNGPTVSGPSPAAVGVAAANAAAGAQKNKQNEETK